MTSLIEIVDKFMWIRLKTKKQRKSKSVPFPRQENSLFLFNLSEKISVLNCKCKNSIYLNYLFSISKVTRNCRHLEFISESITETSVVKSLFSVVTFTTLNLFRFFFLHAKLRELCTLRWLFHCWKILRSFLSTSPSLKHRYLSEKLVLWK